jgi:hypothetical protein
MEKTATMERPRGCLPKTCYITASLPEADCKRLREWLDNGNHLTIGTDDEGVIYIFNDWLMEKWRKGEQV